MPPRSLLPIPVGLALLATFPAIAAEWEVVVRDRARVVELDRTSVLPSDPGTKVAWGRIVLSEEERVATGYATVKALNRYDCNARSFYTIKRVFLDADSNVLRDERVSDQRPIPVEAGSVDERLWRDVCKPPSSMDLKKVAEEAGRAAAAAAARAPSVAQAEGRSESKAVRRADFHPTAKAEQADLTRSTEEVPVPKAEAPAPTPPREVAKPIIALPPPPPSTHVASPPPAAQPAPQAPPPQALPAAARPQPAAALPKVENHAPVALLAGTPAPSRAVKAHREMHWSYQGESGPDNWGRMNPEWSKCASGQRQSPIDIRDGIGVDMEPIRFDYRPSAFHIVDNGHTVQVTPGDGNTFAVMGRRFELVQFHFHRPSEERVDGKAFDMVAHLVHRDQDGRLGVVAVLLEVGPKPNPVVQTLWNNLPLERGSSYGPSDPIDIAQLLPASGDYYAYMGSLTTPPCTEDVLWLVLRQPLQISEDQLRVFSRLYPRNIRPIQSMNDRLIKGSR